MIERFVGICLSQRAIVIVIALLAAAYGVYAWTQLKIEAYPDISDVTAQVTTQALGLPAEDVEQQITIPLERALSNTPGMTTMRSSSTFGLSLITMVFRDGSEDYWERQRIQERVNQVSFPSAIQPGLDPVTGPIDEIFRFTLESDSKNLLELSDIQNWVVAPAFLRVPGIANVDLFGGFTKQYTIEVDPDQLQRFGVALTDVVNAINNNNTYGSGSRIARGQQSYVIRQTGLIRTLDDLGNIVVTQHHGVPVLVRDLGRLEFSHQEREGILGKNNNPDTVQANLQMLKGENPSQVLKAVQAKVAELQEQLDPLDVHIVPYIDRDNLVNSTIEKVGHTIGEGVALVFIVLILFLGSPRSAIVVAITIPLSLVSAFVLMNATKLPANLLSLGSIDFGVIVDGAIVVTEAILVRREAAPDLPLDEQDIKHTAAHVTQPIFFATLIIMTAYLPLLGLERAEAKLFSPIAYTIVYALFGALLCSLMLVPGLAFIAFRKPRKIFHNKPLEALRSGYRYLLGHFLSAPIIVYGIAVVALGTVVVLGITVGKEFLPELDEGSLWLQVQLPSGISLDTASEMASDLRRVIKEFPEVDTAISQLGRSDSRMDPWTFSHIEIPVTLRRYDTWPDHESKHEFVARLRARLDQLPGYQIGISQPIIDNVNDVVAGAHSALVLRVVGQDLKEGRRIGEEVVAVLRTVQGTSQASVFQEPPIPQISVQADRAALARFGLNISDVANLVTNGVGGEPIGQVYVEDRIYNLTTRFPREQRDSPETLGRLLLTAPSGARIPLSQVASIKLLNGESTISHNMAKRNITVRIDYADRDLISYLADAQARIAKDVKFDPTKFRLEWGGQFENQRRAQTRLTIIMGGVLAMMLLFLFIGFGQLRLALLILGVVPLAALGGLIAIHLRGDTLNVATGVGFIALFGVAVQNGILMISSLNHMRGRVASLREAVMEGASERFRPVLMTSTVATVGMLPAALATGIGSDVQRSLATVVVGGLIVATMLTLFILPTLYFVLERSIHDRAEARELVAANQDE
ncbi:MAG: efflux RND transporter permease subunit [Beijerinckiaceae bacterium]